MGQRDDVWWFTSPGGQPFFSFGVNVVDEGALQKTYRPNHPEYASFRHYSNSSEWTRATLTRLRAWNFNTIGGWSSKLFRGGELPYTVVLDLGQSVKAPWGDLFSEEAAQSFDRIARDKIVPLRDDRSLLGYFSDNELGWWDDTLLYHFIAQPESNRTRRVLLSLLEKHYSSDFTRLQRDFLTGKANTFTDLKHGKATLTLRPDGNGAEVIDKFTYLLAERYYRLVHDSIRRYDQNHLILGDRYPGWYPAAVARAAAKWVDVISTNYAADWANGEFARFYLETLYRITRKPILVSEFYWCAMENRSGNKNSSAHFPTVKTQRERAASFRRNVTGLASLPYVVGAHWFQYYDEPTHGRPNDKEDYNMGLVDIDDRPYEELTSTAAKLRIFEVHQLAKPSSEQSTLNQTIPKADRDVERGLRFWNKSETFVPNPTTSPAEVQFADLYASWDAQFLYLAVHAMDFAEPRFYLNEAIPTQGRMLVVVNPASGQPQVRFRFGPGSGVVSQGAKVDFREWRVSIRHTLLLKLPASMFGKTRFKKGNELPLDVSLASHNQARRMKWARTVRLG